MRGHTYLRQMLSKVDTPRLNVKPIPLDPIMQVNLNFQNSKIDNKVNLSVGAYRTNDGKPYQFKCVKEAKQHILDDGSEYAPITGHQGYIEETKNFI